MDMRVIVQRSRVRMQHRDGAGGSLKLPVVVAEGVQRFPTAAHQQIVEHVLMRPGQRPELGRQGEGQQEVLGRQLLLQLPVQPLLALVGLTVRAVAVAAGMGHQMLMLALGALHLHARARLAAALADGGQRPQLLGAEPVAVLRQEIRLEGLDDCGEADHLTAPQAMENPSIRALMRSRA